MTTAVRIESHCNNDASMNATDNTKTYTTRNDKDEDLLLQRLESLIEYWITHDYN